MQIVLRLVVLVLCAILVQGEPQFNIQQDPSLESLFPIPISLSGSQVLRVFWKDLDEIKVKELNNVFDVHSLDIWIANPRERYKLYFILFNARFTDVRVMPSKLDVLLSYFLSASIEHKVLISDVKSLVDSQETANTLLKKKHASFHAAYHTYPEINHFLDKVVKKHSSIASSISIGQTYDNQEIFGVKLGVGKPGDKGYLGEIIFNSGSEYLII
jgi:hypothetical protein